MVTGDIWRQQHQEKEGEEGDKERRGVGWPCRPAAGGWDGAAEWLTRVFRRLMHRKERAGARQATSGTQGGAGGGPGGGAPGGFSGGQGGGVAGPSNNGDTGPKSGGGNTGSGGGGGGGAVELAEVDQFGYPDSPTQTWLAAHADLSPLRILDNISLKSEFPYSVAPLDAEKPPDISNIGLDQSAAQLLQFAASVPVPDHSTTFLDIGLDTFQSLYEDQLMGDLVTAAPALATTTTTDTTFTKLTEIPAGPPVDLRSLGIQNLQCLQLPAAAATSEGAVTMTTPPHTAFKSLAPAPAPAQPPALKCLVEPLPASALAGLIKIEPAFEAGACAVKQEGGEGAALQYPGSPQEPGQGSPHSCGGGKMKSPGARKKSTASTDTEEDDISNIPSLQMRLQIIQQRVSSLNIKADCTIAFLLMLPFFASILTFARDMNTGTVDVFSYSPFEASTAWRLVRTKNVRASLYGSYHNFQELPP